jgi:acetyltransferase
MALVGAGHAVSRLLLLDGSAVTVRPICPADAPLLIDAFNRLSPISRSNRFLGGKSRLTAADLQRLTSVDHCNHEALIAISNGDERAVGVARYIRGRGSRAEVAITVIDAWQRRGLGQALIDRLTDRARDEGVDAFTALVNDGNDGALALLRNFRGHLAVVEQEFGVTEYALDLPREVQQVRRPMASRQATTVRCASNVSYAAVASATTATTLP